MSENRVHPRAPIELKVEYKRLNRFFADYTRNISKGGTFIATARPLPLGTQFVFRLSLPGQPEPIELLGEVIRASAGEEGDPAGMGIRFIFEDERKRAAFAAKVETLMADSLGEELARRLIAQEKN
ncbi:MAG TPA: TIGR02266 family protein [Anaeromyxobacteraceae bacterium]|jgi:type IV pilus assembly protein PilZ|nr:TIGR02266 family protein [Anaeromyxobacteraceae bacterium]